MIEGLKFEAEGHRYTFNGSVVPSVTTVLAPLLWLQGADSRDLEAARIRGTYVHAACHMLNLGTLDEEALDPQLVPYVGAYKNFLEVSGFEVIESEIFVYHSLCKYAGQADFIGNYRGQSWVVDIKTGTPPPTVGAQLAAYREALPVRPNKCACLNLREDGTFKWSPVEPNFSLFQSALNIYRFNQRNQPKESRGHVNEYA